MKEDAIRLPLSEGYLVADRKKCAGCIACMLACSLVHEGVFNPSLSRIQIVQNTWEPFPNDVQIGLCRQCVCPDCVDVCPTDALHIDTAMGNVRRVDESLCTGCGLCVDACPFIPSRIVRKTEVGVVVKCDLCADAPFWNQEGGPHGKQACVEVCPMRALTLVEGLPEQEGDSAYEVNLRNKHWAWLGYPTD